MSAPPHPGISPSPTGLPDMKYETLQTEQCHSGVGKKHHNTSQRERERDSERDRDEGNSLAGLMVVQSDSVFDWSTTSCPPASSSCIYHHLPTCVST